jgi:hypothetical protein
MNINQIKGNIARLEKIIADGGKRPSVTSQHLVGGRWVRDDDIERCLNWNRLALREAAKNV